MPINVYKAKEEHKHLVIEYWNLTFETDRVSSPIQVLPDGSVELIFNFGMPYHATIGDEIFEIKKGFFLRGLILSPISIQFSKHINLWGVRLNPIWCKAYLGLDLAQSFEKVISVSSQDNKLENNPKNETEFYRIFQKLLKNDKGVKADTQLLLVIDEIDKHEGRLNITELSRNCGLSVSSLERKFKSKFGITPKVYSQLIKFKYIIKQLSDDKEIDNAELISSFNLTDHSHLNKIVKSFSHESPQILKSKISRFFTKAYLTD